MISNWTKVPSFTSLLQQGQSMTSEEIEDIEKQKAEDLKRVLAEEQTKYAEKILDMSGISAAFKARTFENFDGKVSGTAEAAKKLCMDYADSFEKIELTRNNGLALLGNPGSGKTHLTIAIANALLARRIPVLYMQYREVVMQLKRLVLDEEEYNRVLNRYKKTRVLLVDDLFKGKITESDINIVFELLNYRYINAMPTILSSELDASALLSLDEGVGSRIIEMCKGRILEIKGKQHNYRLRG